MRRQTFNRLPGLLHVALALFFCLSIAASASPPMVDLNGNGMSDIWELIFGASNLAPGTDTDGDGVINRLEAIAGTNPFDSNSAPRITGVFSSGAMVNVTMTAYLGKQYTLQSTTNFGLTAWVTETNVVVRDGTNVTLAATNGTVAKILRIVVSDVDTDGDGVNDWEEYQLGLDPLNPYSNGQIDGAGRALTDYEYVTGKLASQNVVWITATDPAAIEPDPGQASQNPGQFTVWRGGFPLNAITVALAPGGVGPAMATPGLDFAPLPQSVTFGVGVSSVNITLNPLANTNLLTSLLAQLKVLPGADYTVAASNSASIVIYPTATANGAGLTGLYFTNSSATYTNAANFNPGNLVMTRLDPTVDFVWGNTTNPIPNAGRYCVRWIGQVEPQFSETYYFDANTDDGVKLWVNDQLIVNNWTAHGAEDQIGAITLQGGVRYDIKMEYFQYGGAAVAHLSWYSADQPKQIIPSNRLFPTNVAAAPTTVTSPLTAVAFLGQPFTYTLTGANLPLAYTATGLPPGLSFDSTSNTISGVPTIAGTFQTLLTASNSVGLGASTVIIQVLNTGSAVSEEIWSGVPGTNIADIPLGAPATVTNSLGGLEGPTGVNSNYGERIRGYFTPPATGNYYFWIAGSDSAELWISDDGDPVDLIKRAYVLPTPNPAAPPANGTGSRQWNVQPNQKSGWLSLVAGQPYYIQVLHKAGGGAGDNWAVGWSLDPIGTNSAPTSVVPGYLLSRYFPPSPSAQQGTLYSAQMVALPGVMSDAVGSATLRVSPDGSQATLNFQVNNLSSAPSSEHIDSDPYLDNPSELIFDISAARPQPNGNYTWKITPTGTLQASDILQIIAQGMAAINICSADFPNGEISGHFVLAEGSQTFTPPPSPPSWSDDSTDPNAAARFLIQTTYGPSAADIAAVQSMGYANWLNNQFSLPATHMLPVVIANQNLDPADPFPSTDWFNAWWQNSVTAPDQLRQRVAFALSEIMVVSENGVLTDNATALASYYDILLDNAFGNYRNLLQQVTLSPAMGLYLGMQGNNAGSIVTGVHADENYAREIQQLFSIGLNRLWPDGSYVMNAEGNLSPTYDQNTVMGFASVFTGWNYYQPNQSNGRLPSNWYPASNETNEMVLVPTHHELGSKLILDNIVLPAAIGLQTNSSYTNFDGYGEQDLQAALDALFNHPNVGPFICRQLIQRLVTSNPSPDYLYRVAQVFNDDGNGVRGDLQAVVRAILLDYEARSSDMLSSPTYGKQRESLLRVTAPARAFLATPSQGGSYSQTGTQTITVTTTNAHRLNNGDTVWLNFTNASGLANPGNKAYGVTVTSPNTFNVTAPGLAAGTYGQTNSAITVNISGHGVQPGYWVYLAFTTGGAQNGVYQVVATNSTSAFTVASADAITTIGNCLMPKITGGGYTQSQSNVTFATTYPHGLGVANSIYLAFNSAGSPANGVYQVTAVSDPMHFSVVVTNSAHNTQDNQTVFPLVAPLLNRSGGVTVVESTWNMGYTDGGGSSSLAQSPLRSPTVFNFYYPSYRFPGPLASAGLTTPEFQLTSDTMVALEMNFLQGGILGNSANTNGLCSFTGGNGSIVLDFGPWMTTNNTAAAGLLGLVDSINNLLLAGELSSAAKSNIVRYVTNTVNFPYSSTPTDAQMRDRVKAVVHLIVTSPDFTIQK